MSSLSNKVNEDCIQFKKFKKNMKKYLINCF